MFFVSKNLDFTSKNINFAAQNLTLIIRESITPTRRFVLGFDQPPYSIWGIRMDALSFISHLHVPRTYHVFSPILKSFINGKLV